VKTPDYWGIAGYPISHSLTPKLFEIVGRKVNISNIEQLFLEAKNSEEFKQNITNLEGDLWLSITSPLKHTIIETLQISADININSINQLMRIKGEWFGTNTDGYGFLSAAKHIGIEVKDSILKIRGGGSTARSIAASWTAAGGYIIPIQGRRKLVSGSWDQAIIEDCEADIAVDLDANPGGDVGIEINAKKIVSISYNETSKMDDFAIIMLVSQHLEAWELLFTDKTLQPLPSLDYVLKRLHD
jgi:shikimate 5-dehydrogenase|tara:strand:+ start:23 stop:754 length:732 start_codon:yes stop_codon:yes gene_type:complete